MLVPDISTLSHDCLDRSTDVIRPGMVALRGVAMKLVCDVIKLLCDVRLLWLGDIFLGTRFGDVTAEKLVRYICPTRDTTCRQENKALNLDKFAPNALNIARYSSDIAIKRVLKVFNMLFIFSFRKFYSYSVSVVAPLLSIIQVEWKQKEIAVQHIC